jgi:hypothetical protein
MPGQHDKCSVTGFSTHCSNTPQGLPPEASAHLRFQRIEWGEPVMANATHEKDWWT